MQSRADAAHGRPCLLLRLLSETPVARQNNGQSVTAERRVLPTGQACHRSQDGRRLGPHLQAFWTSGSGLAALLMLLMRNGMQHSAQAQTDSMTVKCCRILQDIGVIPVSALASFPLMLASKHCEWNLCKRASETNAFYHCCKTEHHDWHDFSFMMAVGGRLFVGLQGH